MIVNIDQNALQYMGWGHNLMALCALMYLSWWAIFFRPDIDKVTGILYWCGVACIVAAAIAGIAGAILIGIGTLKASVPGSPSGWGFVIGAIVVYFILMFVTSKAFGRPVTTELILFVAWAAIELAALCTLYSTGLERSAFIWLLASIIVLFIVMLVCYMLYYTLSPAASFVDGALPLAFVGIYSIMVTIMLSPPDQVMDLLL